MEIPEIPLEVGKLYRCISPYSEDVDEGEVIFIFSCVWCCYSDHLRSVKSECIAASDKPDETENFIENGIHNLSNQEVMGFSIHYLIKNAKLSWVWLPDTILDDCGFFKSLELIDVAGEFNE